MNNIELSIITINYNNLEGLRKTIESVTNQTYNNFEYIIIDGGSTDGSVDIIKVNINKLKYWISESDKGIYDAMNKGWKKANGTYCLFLNSGDYLQDNRIIEKVQPYFQTNKDILFGDLILKYKHKEVKAIYPSLISIYDFMLNGTYPHQATFINISLLKKLNGYDEHYKIISDWLFFLKATIEYNVCSVKIPHTISVYDMNGISSTNVLQRDLEIDEAIKKFYPFLTSVRVASKELRNYKLSRAHRIVTKIIYLFKKIRNK